MTDNTVTISQGSSDFATVTIRVDGIALEPDETFQLRLVPNNPAAVGDIFCIDTLDLIIEDGNGMSDRSNQYNHYYIIRSH